MHKNCVVEGNSVGVKDEVSILKHFFRLILNRIPFNLSSLLIIIVFFVAASYLYQLNSDHYKFAKEYLKNSKKVAEILGPVKSMRLGISYMRSGYGSGKWYAKFSVVVEGNKKGTAHFNLENNGDGWTVKNCILDMDGEEFILDKSVDTCCYQFEC